VYLTSLLISVLQVLSVAYTVRHCIVVTNGSGIVCVSIKVMKIGIMDRAVPDDYLRVRMFVDYQSRIFDILRITDNEID
jgi:hypothetical protein